MLHVALGMGKKAKPSRAAAKAARTVAKETKAASSGSSPLAKAVVRLLLLAVIVTVVTVVRRVLVGSGSIGPYSTCSADGTCAPMSESEEAALRASFESGTTNVDLAGVFRASGARATLGESSSAIAAAAPATPLELGLPYVSYLLDAPFAGANRPMGAKFRSFWRRDLEMRWDDGTAEGVYSGVMNAMGFTATNTYTQHAFIFLDRTLPAGEQEVVRYTMRDDCHLYIIDPEASDSRALASEDYAVAVREQTFMRNYYSEHGKPWLAHYPRNKPVLNMWPAEHLGQTHRVVSRRSFFTCDPEAPGNSVTKCRGGEPVNINLQVVATAPRVFVVEDLLSEFECEYIKAMGTKIIKRSTVGNGANGFTSNTRTSQTAWVKRSSSTIMEQIFGRAADALGVEDSTMQHDTNAEHLQVVRYLQNQEYTAHHDFGYAKTSNQRILTLLLYIDVPEEGGGTSFPKAFGNRGLVVRPPKGSGVLFYSMTGDGNADDDSLHSGMRVVRGRKWICNMWVWDPRLAHPLP